MRGLLVVALALAGCHSSPASTSRSPGRRCSTSIRSPVSTRSSCAGRDRGWHAPSTTCRAKQQTQAVGRRRPRSSTARSSRSPPSPTVASSLSAAPRRCAGARTARQRLRRPGQPLRRHAERTRARSSARFGASATRLGDGRVLLAGGATRGSPGAPDPSSISPLVELYDPADGTFKIFAAARFDERIYHAAGATSDGGVLFAGGLGKFGPIDDIYKIDPQALRLGRQAAGPALGRRGRRARDGRSSSSAATPASDGMGGGSARRRRARRRRRRRHDLGRAADAARLRRRHPPRRRQRARHRRRRRHGPARRCARSSRRRIEQPSRRCRRRRRARADAVAARRPLGDAACRRARVFVFGGNDGHSSIAAAELWSPDVGGFVDSPLFNVRRGRARPRQRSPTAASCSPAARLSPQRMSVPSPVLDPLDLPPDGGGRRWRAR